MSNTARSFDLVVLGGGPGGYVAAIRAAQLGLTTCVIDEQPLGGVCVNWGCIPSKALLKTAEFYSDIKHHAADFGISVTPHGVQWERVIKRSREVSQKNSSGVEFLVKKLGIHRLNGRFRISSDGVIEINAPNSNGEILDRVRGTHVIIATGSVNRSLPGVTVDGERIITYKEAMSLPEQPGELIVIGGGAIGIEFAYFYAALGTRVTVIEMLPRILPIEDAESSVTLARSLKKMGITLHTSTKVDAIARSGNRVEMRATNDSGMLEISGDVCLVAIGFRANTEGWGFESLEIELDRGFIKVDESYRTSQESYFAIGDVIGAPQLAHVASHEGIVAVEHIAGLKPHPVDYTIVPSCTYCQPQVASVGYTEEKLKESGTAYKSGKFPFSASGKANAVGHIDGFVKLLFDESDDTLLGAHIVGSDATEMIAELCLARRMKAKSADIYETIHAHPTMGEAVMEAAMAAHGRAIHYLGRA